MDVFALMPQCNTQIKLERFLMKKKKKKFNIGILNWLQLQY